MPLIVPKLHAVKAWIAELPLTNVADSSRRVCGALGELNSTALAAPQHHKILELFRAPVYHLTELLKRPCLQTAAPLLGKSTEAAASVRELQSALATGYYWVADALLCQSRLHQHPGIVACALQRALYHHGQELLMAYQIYQGPRKESWLTVHDLYHRAERKGLLDSAVKDRHLGGITTVGETYKQLLLLALADPGCLTPTEIGSLFLMLRLWSPLCRLYSPIDLGEAPAMFVVDLGADAPPSHYYYCQSRLNPHCRTLDTAALTHSLRDHLQRTAHAPAARSAPATDPRTHLAPAFLRRLLLAWGVASKRGYLRGNSRAMQIEAAIGLSATYQLLRDFASTPDGQRSMVPLSVHASTVLHSNADIPVYHCVVINESSHGACLGWDREHWARLRVGELIAVRHRRTHWGIAVIRWLKTNADRDLASGVQILTLSASPVLLWRYDQSALERDNLPGLLLPALSTSRQPSSVIVPSRLYQCGEVLALHAHTNANCVRLDAVIEDTPVYTRFHYTDIRLPNASPLDEGAYGLKPMQVSI